MEQLVIDGRKIVVSDLPEGPKPFALVPFRQIEVEDHAMAIRVVFRRHVLQISELQLHKLQRQEAEKPGRQSHLGRFPGEPRPLPLQIRHRPGLDDWCKKEEHGYDKERGQATFLIGEPPARSKEPQRKSSLSPFVTRGTHLRRSGTRSRGSPGGLRPGTARAWRGPCPRTCRRRSPDSSRRGSASRG